MSDAETRLAAVRAILDADLDRRAACAAEPDCPCSHKDCYECGEWHNCTHTPLTAIREALA